MNSASYGCPSMLCRNSHDVLLLMFIFFCPQITHILESFSKLELLLTDHVTKLCNLQLWDQHDQVANKKINISSKTSWPVPAKHARAAITS